MARYHRKRRDDDGFSLLEVVIAMAVFTITVGAVLGVMIRVLDVTRSNTHRVAAANLATKQIESTRSMRTLDIPDGAVVRSETVAGTSFTLTQTSNYVVAGSNGSVCRGTGDELAYKLVSVEVTWPNMGSVQPVRADTLKSLGLGTNGLNATRGALAVLVEGGTGSPEPGVRVTLNPGGITRTTGPDGCAVFVNLTVGTSYTAAAGQTGYVGHQNTRAAQLTQGVQPGRITRAKLLYDAGRLATVTWTAPAGHLPPAALPLRYRTSYVSDGAVLPVCPAGGDACRTTIPGTLQNLFPAVYDVNGGSCTDARTGTADADLRAGNGAFAVPLAGYTVEVDSKDTGSLANWRVTASHAPESTAMGCTSGETYHLLTDATGRARFALPHGRWTFSVAGADSKTVTVKKDYDVTTVKLKVDKNCSLVGSLVGGVFGFACDDDDDDDDDDD